MLFIIVPVVLLGGCVTCGIVGAGATSAVMEEAVKDMPAEEKEAMKEAMIEKGHSEEVIDTLIGQ